MTSTSRVPIMRTPYAAPVCGTRPGPSCTLVLTKSARRRRTVQMQPEHPLPRDLFGDLDKTSPAPLYYQVATRLEAAIQDDVLPPGARLENEISLGQRLGLSRPTIRRAIQELVD